MIAGAPTPSATARRVEINRSRCEHVRGRQRERGCTRRVSAWKAVVATTAVVVRSLARDQELGAAVRQPADPRRGHDRRSAAAAALPEPVRGRIRGRDVRPGQPEGKEGRQRDAGGVNALRLAHFPKVAVYRRRPVDRYAMHAATQSRCCATSRSPAVGISLSTPLQF